MTKKYKVAVVGATGLVGVEIIRLLNSLNFPFLDITALASSKSNNKILTIDGKNYIVKELDESSFKDMDIVFFSAGGKISKAYAPIAVKSKAIVIDNTSYFRMNKDAPLVAYGVNDEMIKKHRGIIANPNCSTIQMVKAIKPLNDEYKIKKIVVSTYQAVSGAGQKAVTELKNQIGNETSISEVLPYGNGKKHYPIAFNLLPQIDDFDLDSGFSLEELKMINETNKILNTNIEIIPTCVRVPVFRGHSESIYLEFENKVDLNKVYDVLKKAPLVFIEDDLKEQLYPQPINASNNHGVYIGRIRKPLNNDYGLIMWVVADNLLIGAALNAILIAFKLVEYELL